MKKIIIISIAVVLAITGLATFLILNKDENQNKQQTNKPSVTEAVAGENNPNTSSKTDESSKLDNSSKTDESSKTDDSSKLDNSSKIDESSKTDESSKLDNSSKIDESSKTDESSKVEPKPQQKPDSYEPSFDDKHFYTGTMTKEKAIKDYPIEEAGSPYGSFYNTGVDLTMEGSVNGVIKKDDDELGAIQSFSQYGFFSEDRKIFFGIQFDGGWVSGAYDPSKMFEESGFYEGGEGQPEAVSAYKDPTFLAPNEINLSYLFANNTFKDIRLTYDDYYLLKKDGKTEPYSCGRRHKGYLSKTNGRSYNFEGYDFFMIGDDTSAYHIIAVDMSKEQNQPISKEIEKVLFTICG